jgi:hypothetical protein
VALNPILHDFDIGLSPIESGTPKSSRDISKLAQQSRDVNPIFGNPVARQLFRKIGKGLNHHIIQNATAETRSNSLQKTLDRMKPKKRNRVVPVPKEEFVRMAGVLEVRRLMPGYIRLEGDGDEEVKSEIGNIEDYNKGEYRKEDRNESESNWSDDN